MGDYKLKTAKDYVVPESQRVNADKKRRQMLLLEESLHAIHMGYNHRFLALRDLKRRIIVNIESDNRRVGVINSELKDLYENSSLGQPQKFIKPFQPSEDLNEFPEQRMRFDGAVRNVQSNRLRCLWFDSTKI
jgi:hypothetical protein